MKRSIYKPHYFYIFFALLAVGLIGVSHVRAQEEDVPHAEIPHAAAEDHGMSDHATEDTHMDTRDEHQATIEERKEAHKAALEERIQNRVFNLTENVTNRMHAAVNRLRDIGTRIESRTQKLEDQGVDTGVTADLLGDIFIGLDLADRKLDAMPSRVEAAVTSDDPRAAFKEIRTTFGDVKDILIRAHSLLRDALALLKEAVRQAERGRGVSDAVTDAERNDTETPHDELEASASDE